MAIDPIGVCICGPLTAFSEGYANDLASLGYAPASVHLRLKVLADLSGWLLDHGMVAGDLRSSDLDRFLHDRRAAGHTRYVSFRAVHPILDYLQRLELLPPRFQEEDLSAVEPEEPSRGTLTRTSLGRQAASCRSHRAGVRTLALGRASHRWHRRSCRVARPCNSRISTVTTISCL